MSRRRFRPKIRFRNNNALINQIKRDKEAVSYALKVERGITNALTDENKNLKNKNDSLKVGSEGQAKLISKLGDLFKPSAGEEFVPFATVEHLQEQKTILDNANKWVEEQKLIRSDYMGNINDLLSQADTGIQDIYSKAKRIDDYKVRLYLTHIAIRVVLVGIIVFLAGFGIKIIIEKSRN